MTGSDVIQNGGPHGVIDPGLATHFYPYLAHLTEFESMGLGWLPHIVKIIITVLNKVFKIRTSYYCQWH